MRYSGIVDTVVVPYKNRKRDEDGAYRLALEMLDLSEFDTMKKLFKHLQSIYGKCVSGMFTDTKKGETKKIGWVFEKKQKHEEMTYYPSYQRFFIQQTWISLSEKCTCCSGSGQHQIDLFA